ncbi:MAG: HNH endonuclease, partial [Spirulinaceae cyanobacterium]
FQQRFECTSDSLYVILFGLRGSEGNPIVQMMKKYQEEVTQLLGLEEYQIISSAIEFLDKDEELELRELISKLKMVTEREWASTYIKGRCFALPIQEIDSAWPLIYDFVRIFPIFRAAANLRLGKDDCFEYYAGSFWTWQNQLQGSSTAIEIFPDEIDSTEIFREGCVRQVLVNTYERDPQARQKCIDYYGSSCSVCNFDFGKAFGKLGKGFIHVHHLRPISEIAEEYEIDPIEDLRPVCPNCHAMIHRHSPPFSIEEMRILLKSNPIQD